jgi:hypothetical protein
MVTSYNKETCPLCGNPEADVEVFFRSPYPNQYHRIEGCLACGWQYEEKEGLTRLRYRCPFELRINVEDGVEKISLWEVCKNNRMHRLAEGKEVLELALLLKRVLKDKLTPYEYECDTTFNKPG